MTNAIANQGTQPKTIYRELKKALKAVEKIFSWYSWTKFWICNALLFFATLGLGYYFFSSTAGSAVIESVGKYKILQKLGDPLPFLATELLKTVPTILFGFAMSLTLLSVCAYVFQKCGIAIERWLKRFDITRHLIFAPSSIVINATAFKANIVAALCLSGCISLSQTKLVDYLIIVLIFSFISFWVIVFLKLKHKIKYSEDATTNHPKYDKFRNSFYTNWKPGASLATILFVLAVGFDVFNFGYKIKEKIELATDVFELINTPTSVNASECSN